MNSNSKLLDTKSTSKVYYHFYILMMTIVLQNRATIDYLLLLKHNLSCQQFTDTCCFNVSDFPYTIGGEINDLHRETDKNLS